MLLKTPRLSLGLVCESAHNGCRCLVCGDEGWHYGSDYRTSTGMQRWPPGLIFTTIPRVDCCRRSCCSTAALQSRTPQAVVYNSQALTCTCRTRSARNTVTRGGAAPNCVRLCCREERSWQIEALCRCRAHPEPPPPLAHSCVIALCVQLHAPTVVWLPCDA